MATPLTSSEITRIAAERKANPHPGNISKPQKSKSLTTKAILLSLIRLFFYSFAA